MKQIIQQLRSKLSLLLCLAVFLLVGQYLFAGTYPASTAIYVKYKTSSVTDNVKLFVWNGTKSMSWCGDEMASVGTEGDYTYYKITYDGTFKNYIVTTNSCNTKACSSSDGSVNGDDGAYRLIDATGSSYSMSNYLLNTGGDSSFGDVSVGKSKTVNFVFEIMGASGFNPQILNNQGGYSLGTATTSGNTYTVPVTFTPTTTGSKTATLYISYAAGGIWQTDLSATGVQNTYIIHANFNGSGWDDYECDADGNVTTYLNVASHELSVNVNGTYRSNSGTMTRSNCTGWTLSTNTANMWITADVAGYYTFNVYSSDSKYKISATYAKYYQIKHQWGGSGDWTWKTLSEDATSGTYSVVAEYGATGCNWKEGTSGTENWIASPTLSGSPTTGDECTFTLDPSEGTITITKIVTCTQPSANFAITGQLNADEDDPWEGSVADGTNSGTGGYFANSHRTITLTTDQTVDTYAWVNDSKPTGSSITWSNQTSQTATAQVSLPGTYTFHLNANCTGESAVSSKTVTIEVPYPEIGVNGPFIHVKRSDYDWDCHSYAAGDGLLTRSGLTWSKTFTVVKPSSDFCVIQRYKNGCTANTSENCDAACCPGWDGYTECGSPESSSTNNKIIWDSPTLTNVATNSNNYKASNLSLSAGDKVTITVTMSAYNTYTLAIAKVCETPSITASSLSAQTLCQNASADTLSVTATGTSVTYQWYSYTNAGGTEGETLINDATSYEYQPSTATAGTLYYKCKVTACETTVPSSVSGAIQVDATSVAGTVTPDASSVCSGTGTTLRISGNTGSTYQWQSSTSESGTYSDIQDATSETYATGNLTATTYYKVKVKNGSCDYNTSTAAAVTVKAIATASQYTLSNYTKTYGNVSAPTISPADGAGTVETIYYEGTSGTSYTKSSTLPTNAGTYKVYVDVNDGTTYCGATGIELSDNFTINKADQADLTLSADESSACVSVGSITFSTSGGSGDGAVTYSITSGTGGSITTGGVLTATSAGSFTVQATKAASANYNKKESGTVTVTFDATSAISSITGAAEICSGASATLSIGSHTGNIKWFKSTGGDYTEISGETSASLSTGALTQTTSYKAQATNGSCAAAESAVATVTVKAQTIARTDANTFEVQIGSNDTKTLTFTQCGYSVASGDITLGGTHASEFSLGTPTISGESISVDLTFTPTSYGSKTVYVQIIDATHQFSITASALCTASEFTTVYNSAKTYNKVGGAINITSVGTCGIAEAGFKVYSDQACTNLVATNNSLDKTVGEHKGTVTISNSYNKKYYIKAYITDNNGNTTYGDAVENCTKMLPSTSTGPENVTSTSATIRSKVPTQGNMTVTMTKVQFKFTSGAYTTWTDASNVPQVGGTATLDVTGLTPNTSYKMCVQYIYNVTLNGVEESITAGDNCKTGYLTTLNAFSSVTIDATASVCAGSTVTPTKSSTPEADSWEFASSDETVATVDASGIVTGVKAGTATITATAKKDGYESKSASCAVTVNAVTAISAHPSISAVSYCVGNTATPLTVTATGTNISYQWMSCESAEGTYTNVTTGTGAATSSYTPSTDAASALYYKCKVSGTCGDVTSNASGLIKVNAVPSITSISANSDCGAGDITFTSTGVTTGATVNWYEGTSNVGTGSTKTYSAQAAGTSKTLKATAVKDGCESAATEEATGERKAVPSLTVTLSSTAITAGETDKTYGWEVATFTPNVTGGTLTTSSVTQTTGSSGIISGNTAKGHVGDAFTGSYTATADNGCTSSVNKTVTVIKATENCN